MNAALQSMPSRDVYALYTLRRTRGDAPAAIADTIGAPADRAMQPGAWTAVGRFFAASVDRVRTGLRKAHASYRAYRVARETLAALRSLDDRTLHDLGYHRSEIESVAAEIAMAGERASP